MGCTATCDLGMGRATGGETASPLGLSARRGSSVHKAECSWRRWEARDAADGRPVPCSGPNPTRPRLDRAYRSFAYESAEERPQGATREGVCSAPSCFENSRASLGHRRGTHGCGDGGESSCPSSRG